MMNCPLCKSEALTRVFIKGNTPYFKCCNCKFKFSVADNNPNFDNALETYESSYLDYFKVKIHDEKNYNIIFNWISKYNERKNFRILDIGCGSGKFVRFLRNLGYDAYGLEPSSVLYQTFLEGESYFYNFTTQEFLANQPDRKFDIVTLFDVLEHIKNPNSIIRDISNLLIPKSYIFISTPNANSLFAKILNKRWHYFNKYHFSYFSPSTIKLLAKMNDLKYINLCYLTRYYSLYYLFNYFFDFFLNINIILPEIRTTG